MTKTNEHPPPPASVSARKAQRYAFPRRPSEALERWVEAMEATVSNNWTLAKCGCFSQAGAAGLWLIPAARAGFDPKTCQALAEMDMIGLEMAAQSYAHKRQQSAARIRAPGPAWARVLFRFRSAAVWKRLL